MQIDRDLPAVVDLRTRIQSGMRQVHRLDSRQNGPNRTYCTFAEELRFSHVLSDNETAIVKARAVFFEPFRYHAFVCLRQQVGNSPMVRCHTPHKVGWRMRNAKLRRGCGSAAYIERPVVLCGKECMIAEEMFEMMSITE